MLLVVTALIVISTYIALGFYAYPSADDFCMANGVEQNGLFAHLWHHYLFWSGRYSGNAFYAIYPLLFGFFSGYPWLAVILILLLYAGAVFFLSSLFRLNSTSALVLLTALGFVCVYLLGLRHTASSLYWMAGSLSYQTANIFILFTLGLIIRLIDKQQVDENYRSTLLPLLALIVVGMGCNETNLITLMGVTSLPFLLHIRLGWKVLKPWFWVLVVSVICFALVYFAPGNAVRESTFPYRHDLLHSIAGSLRMGLWSISVWTLNPVFIVASLLVPFIVSRLYRTSDRIMTISPGLIVVMGLITLSIPFVLQFPAWWSMGGWPPPRTVDAIFFVFLLSWSLTLGALVIRFLSPGKVIFDKIAFIGKPVTIFWLTAILFSLAVAINSKFQRAQNDLWNRVQPFAQYMLERQTRITQALDKQQGYARVPVYKEDYPRSIYFNDIRTDSRDWRNVCYARYFGLQGISREPPTTSNRHDPGFESSSITE